MTHPSPSLPRRPWWTAAALLGLLAMGSALAQLSPVVDDLGRTVVLDAPAMRVVTMTPSHTEVVCALVGCDRLVGRDAASDAPAEAVAVPDLGSAFAPDVEAIVAARADLVLADVFTGFPELLEPLGIAVYAGTPQRLADVPGYLRAMGTLLGAEEAAEALWQELEAGFAEVAAAVEGATAPRVLIELDASVYAAGQTSFIGGLLEIAGGVNVAGPELGDYPLLGNEFILVADPQVILLLDAPWGVTAADVARRPGWPILRAVMDGRVVEVSAGFADLLSRPGPRLALAVRGLAEILHPERF